MASRYNSQKNVQLRAISYDYGMKELLEDSSDNNFGYVHSIFKKVLNFSDRRNMLYSIALGEVCNGPRTLRVDNSPGTNLEDLGVDIGERVQIENATIYVGNKLIIDLAGAELWVPKDFNITWEAFENFKNNLKVYNNYLLLNGAYGGAKYFYMDKFLDLPHNVKASLIEKELCKRIEGFLCSVILKENNFYQRVNSLIGFGSGLTPSGDDFLTGFIVFLYHLKIESWNYLFDEMRNILSSQRLLTTDISRNMLYASLDGMAAESVLDFIDALLFKEKDMFIKSMNNLFAIGSSSGTDISVGIITAAMLSFNLLGMEVEKWYQKL